jgi:mannosyl-3-phosphoglycerate phosphatase family protein
MKEMGLSTPCIVENGCGIFVPEKLDLLSDQPSKDIPGFGKLVKLCVSNLIIQKAISKLSLDMGIDFRPYSKLTLLKISKITGLSEAAAQRAQNREFSETLTASLDDEVWKEVNTRLNEVDLQCLCGGRFYTVTSQECNKGTAMKMLMDAYRSSERGNWKSIAIGDSANDYDMLQSADQGYLVQKSDGSWNEMNIPRLKQISGIGPQGWVEAIRDAIGLVP